MATSRVPSDLLSTYNLAVQEELALLREESPDKYQALQEAAQQLRVTSSLRFEQQDPEVQKRYVINNCLAAFVDSDTASLSCSLWRYPVLSSNGNAGQEQPSMLWQPGATLKKVPQASSEYPQAPCMIDCH